MPQQPLTGISHASCCVTPSAQTAMCVADAIEGHPEDRSAARTAGSARTAVHVVTPPVCAHRGTRDQRVSDLRKRGFGDETRDY